MANLFARVRFKSGPTEGDNIVFVADIGDLIQPLTGKPQPPAPLDNEPNVAPPGDDFNWIPGNWVYRETRFVWRPGYWSPFLLIGNWL